VIDATFSEGFYNLCMSILRTDVFIWMHHPHLCTGGILRCLYSLYRIWTARRSRVSILCNSVLSRVFMSSLVA